MFYLIVFIHGCQRSGDQGDSLPLLISTHCQLLTTSCNTNNCLILNTDPQIQTSNITEVVFFIVNDTNDRNK